MLGMSNTLHTNDSPLQLIDLDALAKSTSFIRRKTQGVSALGIIIALIKCVSKGDGSFNNIAIALSSLVNKPLTKSAVYKRINEKCVEYLQKVIEAMLEIKFTPPKALLTKLGCTSIIMEDSSFVPMGQLNAGNFPAHGNGKVKTAGCKVDLAFDLLSNTVIHQEFTHGTHQDKDLGKRLLDKLKKGDLVLRDMGYFDLGSFKRIAEIGAFWVTRLPANVNVRFENGEKLEKRLRSRKSDVIDETVFVGEEGMEMRLVAVRAEGKVASERRRTRRKKAKDAGRTPNNQSLIRDGWHIMLTNLTEANANDVFDVYRLRWNIETRFKAWKQSLQLTPALKQQSNEAHLECLVLAALIHQLTSFQLFAQISKQATRFISIEKLCEVISDYFGSLKKKDLHSPFRTCEDHVKLESSGRKSLMQILLTL